ncbi:MAG: hypothetical protein FJ390_00225 [Verrucomicrobia bacterium]|nr:hypothetical protein [Verrucomicrobiota bacterium]
MDFYVKKFDGLGPATLGEKTALLPKRPSGVFGDHQISMGESEEKSTPPTVSNDGLKIGLYAAKLSGKADAIETKVTLCKPEEVGKKDLLSKAQTAYNQAAKAKAMSDVPESLDQSETWDHIATLYESAGSLFEKSAHENLKSQETKENITSAEAMTAKADAMKQKLRRDEPSPLPIQDEDEGTGRRHCVIS